MINIPENSEREREKIKLIACINDYDNEAICVVTWNN